jgi:sterol desaturase/sphingolipid hydroxylase (fatty acid hydroxylase superfamily)
MSYERDLAFNLRVGGLTEDEIAETLDEVRAHQSSAGTPAAEEFGSAQAYAKQFPKREMRTRGSAITVIGVTLAIAYVAVVLLLLPLLGIYARDALGPIGVWPAGVVILAGVLAGFLADYLRPVPRSRVTR